MRQGTRILHGGGVDYVGRGDGGILNEREGEENRKPGRLGWWMVRDGLGGWAFKRGDKRK